MVVINLIMEGNPPQGVLNDNANLMTNTVVLRQSLNNFYQRLLGRTDIRVVVDLGANKNSSVYKYARNKEDNTYLYVDLDAPSTDISQWFTAKQQAAAGKGLSFDQASDADHVFFMIQEMEAWFLKQPSCIETWASEKGYCREHNDEVLEQHSLIRGKDIEQIAKPSDKLGDIIKHFYVELKKDGVKGKKVKYNKMKSAPGLIDALNVVDLLQVDAQLSQFKVCLENKTT